MCVIYACVILLQHINKILVTPEPDDTLRLDIKISAGKTAQKYLEKRARRMGHTFKWMKVWENRYNLLSA